jgi:hypothetical protein
MGLLQVAAPAPAEEAPQKTISRITGVAADPNWAEEYAYSLGVQAYVFAFPWYYNQLLRWLWVSQPPRHERSPSMPMNALWHSRRLLDATYRDGGSPNNDTLYSIAWVDVSKEPIIVSVPEIVGRYYSICLTGFDADNFDYIGTRATGTGAGHYAIVGPQWQGELPQGVKALKTAPTPMVFMLVRTMVNGSADLETVHRLQNQYTLTPLSLWGKPGVKAPEVRDDWGPYNAKVDPLADWKTINRAMTENPPPARYDTLAQSFARIGVGPGKDVEKVDAATRRGLVRALEAGKRVATGAATASDAADINGWRYFPSEWGHAGLTGNYILRAGPTSLAGIATNDLVEAMYPMATRDAGGEQLTGTRKYVLRFGKHELPPVNAFWSLTAYGMDFNLIANPIERHALGDRSGLQRDAEGGITLYVQKDSPGKPLESNWLPVSGEDFYLVLRLYLPQPAAIEQKWRVPAVTRVD